MDIKNIKRRISNFKLSVVGYKTGNEPDWLRLKRLVYRQAMVEESDEQALTAIVGEVRRHPKAAREARELLASSISCYDADRAVRLIDAAIDGLPIKPVRPEYAELFEQEARLGRMPLREAFAEVASRVPRIERIGKRFEESNATAVELVDERSERSPSDVTLLRDAQHEVDQIIGPQSQHPDPLLRSYLSRNIAYSWLGIIFDSPPYIDPNMSYFSRFDAARKHLP
jgi:hypothetical protein